MKDILITGYPSFVARKLLDRLYATYDDSNFRLLVRPDYVDEARKMVEAFSSERMTVLSGDVVAMDLGLSGSEYLDLIENVTDIYHIASIWWLGVNRKTIRDVNELGARNVIDAAVEMKKLNRLNHFSTAFVAGDRQGVIMESELDVGQKFRNAYEQTKFRAEVMMREAMNHIPISVFRPAIIVGDATTGEIDKMAGPYYLLTAMMMMPANIPIVMPGKGDKPLNMVPIDYVSDAMVAISSQEEAVGKTFHLCDPNPLSARKVFELVASEAGRPAPVGRLPYSIAKLVMKLPYLEKATRSPRQFLDDFNQLTIYNSINTTEMMQDVRCPPFPSYVERLVAFVKSNDATFDVEMPDPGEILG